MATVPSQAPAPSSVFNPFTSSFGSLPSAFPSSSARPTSSNNDGGMPTISRSSSLLFGFLITFFALFTGFMACAYSSRRAAHIDRARYAAQLRDLGYHKRIKVKKPRLWDVRTHEASGAIGWNVIQPLSAALVHPVIKGESSRRLSRDSDGTPQALLEHDPPQEYFPLFFLGSRSFPRSNFVPSVLQRYRRSPREPEPDVSSRQLPNSTLMTSSRSGFSSQNEKQGKAKETRGAREDRKDVQTQVSVLIAMPSPARSSEVRLGKCRSLTDNEQEIIEEYREGQLYHEIGVADVPIRRLDEWNTP